MNFENFCLRIGSCDTFDEFFKGPVKEAVGDMVGGAEAVDPGHASDAGALAGQDVDEFIADESGLVWRGVEPGSKEGGALSGIFGFV